MCITLLVLEDSNESFHQVSLLKKITPTQALVTKSIDKRHSVLKDTSITLQKQFIDDLVLLISCFVGTVKQIIVHVRVNHLLQCSLSSCLRKSPSECLQSRTYFDGLVRFKKEVFDQREV